MASAALPPVYRWTAGALTPVNRAARELALPRPAARRLHELSAAACRSREPGASELRLEPRGSRGWLLLAHPLDRRRCQALAIPLVWGHDLAGLERATRPLRPREREVLQLLGAGCASQEIAATLGISRHTVRTHLKHLYRALDVAGRAEARALLARWSQPSPSWAPRTPHRLDG